MATQTKARSDKAPRRTYTPEEIHEFGTPKVSWKACLLGLVAGEVLLFVLVQGGILLTNRLFGTAGLAQTNGIDGGVVGAATLLAVIFGGYVAGRRVKRFWGYQGVVVGVGFILVGAVTQFVSEAWQLHVALANHTHTLINWGSMDMGNLFAGDFLALFGGGVGGWLAHRGTPAEPHP